LDLTNNDLIVDYTGGSSPLTAIEALVASGYHGGDWLGKGITSSTAHSNPGLYSLVVLDNATRPTHFGSFDGIDTSSHDQVIVEVLVGGGPDLDGQVTPNDAIVFAKQLQRGPCGQPPVGRPELQRGLRRQRRRFLFANAYNESLPHLPEPASLGVLALGATALLLKRRK